MLVFGTGSQCTLKVEAVIQGLFRDKRSKWPARPSFSRFFIELEPHAISILGVQRVKTPPRYTRLAAENLR